MTDIPESSISATAQTEDPPGANSPSFDIPSNKYSDIFGLWPPEIWEGFEEFVKESRERSAERREPPPWW